MNGTIFDIKEFSIHDGPGARITVFLKGCPLRCVWCHNPEGLVKEIQLLHKENICGHCGKCCEPCNHPECQPYGRCLHACANGALELAGKMVSSDELAETILKDANLLETMNGGVTFSGGEPLMQSDFVVEVAKKLPNVHKAIQTSGYAEPNTYQKVIGEMDFVMQDIKLIDEELHKKYTGVSNQKILENIKWLKQSGKEFVFRVPMIPNITDTKENLDAIKQLTEGYLVEYLPYNTMAGAKYPMVGKTYEYNNMF